LSQNKSNKPSEEKKEIKNDIQFDIFNFGDSNPKKNETNKNNEKKNK
jgi:hypothetical protein